MITNQEKGREFEREMEKEFGLKLVPGSGNQWFGKLDLAGRGGRWSLKYTGAESFRLTQEDVREAYTATQGVAGDGSTPVWLIRIGSPDYDMVVLTKNDFVRLQNGELNLVGADAPRKSDERRARARVPVLLRDNADQ